MVIEVKHRRLVCRAERLVETDVDVMYYYRRLTHPQMQLDTYVAFRCQYTCRRHNFDEKVSARRQYRVWQRSSLQVYGSTEPLTLL